MTAKKHTTIVFAGPSLPNRYRPTTKCISWCPPARRGDFSGIDLTTVERVILLDGVMVFAHAPSPTEIAEVLAANVEVWGASSLGALRAVELAELGMRGYGWIYEQFRRGEMTADDELVALLDTRSNEAVGLFAANIRYACGRLTDAGLLSAQQAMGVVTQVTALHFEARTRESVLKVVSELGVTPATAARLLSDEFDIKRHDALGLLAHRGLTC